MTRTITAASDTAARAEVARPVLLGKLDFASGVVALNTGTTTISYGGDDYLGVGAFAGVDPVQEGTDVQPYGIKLTLSGVPTDLISVALGEDYQGRDVSLYLALLDSDHQPIADPVLLFLGRMDYMEVEVGNTSIVTVTAESRLIDWDRARVRRFNNEDQIDRYPSDRGLEFVPQMVEKELIWGRT